MGAVFDGGIGMLNRKNQPAVYQNYLIQRYVDYANAEKKHRQQRANERFLLTLVALAMVFVVAKVVGL